ncbi:MAG TPA: hypothetical protein VKB38_05905 [Terracidiphilus sp.]|nr:hypothetical protein [Terracidiphilus sp.]
MDDSRPAEFHSGANGDYRWIVADATIGELLGMVPESVLGKYVAVTSFDPGPLALTEEQEAKGWHSCEGIAYSPKIESIENLPHDNFDEWYVFREPRNLGCLVCSDANPWVSEFAPQRVHVFVNYSSSFGLHLAESRALAELFWEQLDWMQPETYISHGDRLTVVTRDHHLMTAIVTALHRT